MHEKKHPMRYGDGLGRLLIYLVKNQIEEQDVCLEIILIDAGSSEYSGTIAEKYAVLNKRVSVIRSENSGMSTIKNKGISIAQGEYILFADCNNRITENSLCELYRLAKRKHADVVMGLVKLSNPDDGKPSNLISKELFNKQITGKNGFCKFVESGIFSAKVSNYMFRRDYLEKIQIRFDENIIFEDELWTPLVSLKIFFTGITHRSSSDMFSVIMSAIPCMFGR